MSLLPRSGSCKNRHQFSMRFGSLATQAVRAIKLIPANVVNEDNLNESSFHDIVNYYKDDMPEPA